MVIEEKEEPIETQGPEGIGLISDYKSLSVVLFP